MSPFLILPYPCLISGDLLLSILDYSPTYYFQLYHEELVCSTFAPQEIDNQGSEEAEKAEEYKTDTNIAQLSVFFHIFDEFFMTLYWYQNMFSAIQYI